MRGAPLIVTAGPTYLDIDAYACCVALAELLCLQGEEALAYSTAPVNYSVSPSLWEEGLMAATLPAGWASRAAYVIADVSDPDFLGDSVPLGRVSAVYDHHVGFETYWQKRLGESARIEFIGAAATLILREWDKAGLRHRMRPNTARLLAAAILDNTLDLTSANTTREDREAFAALCRQAGLDDTFRAAYFSEVQTRVEADLRSALLGDVKTVRHNPILPPRVAQLSVWEAERVLGRLPEIRQWLDGPEAWMINLIDIKHRRSYLVCDEGAYQNKIGSAFGVPFAGGVASLPRSYLRKEIIKKTYQIHEKREDTP